ncbi:MULTISPECIES: ABC transporter permease [Brevibacillus]|uniref:ABC-type transport system, permease n=1 Tax=Brevibacillus laterosporus LMG 15441 TaxID=1042163 RepID=A0A075RC64_BRELA|nr:MULTISPECIES: ABC transporter permease [Brevibacillus]AIG27085.1 ABC-type transport system, permease [Brevibacillus laterosporus LMG 15441]AYK08502.1 ABC transporter permease [Brevibacillus laterosporus]MCR8962752.1 ABC transporter permease [Brevibacillus laterosporus]MCZ0834907.1 ABC transporter permease [Brevibacillus halotolerans]MDF9411474.1 ABC transporter permease [Brevibacillus laterosporus]
MNIAIVGAIEQGLLFAVMVLGVFLTFRILNFPDLTVDGSFAMGGAIAATLIVDGMNPFLATALAMAGGAIAGVFTGVLTTKGKINGLLAGILTMIALYSINLRIMGKKSNIPLLREETLYTKAQAVSIFDFQIYGVSVASSIVFLIMVLIVKLMLDWFLHTDLGLDIRATGDNDRMIRSFGANTDTTTIIGLALSNALVAASGALVAQYQGFADVGMGIGMIVIGLASVIIGEVLFGTKSIMRLTLAVILGSIVYRLVIAFALRQGFLASDMKLITAIIVIIALILPNIMKGVWKIGRTVKGG